jgi:hypothetical protein
MPALFTSTEGQPSMRVVARSQALTSDSRLMSALKNSVRAPRRRSARSVARPWAAFVSASDTA